jgi:hypothetical protein
MSQKRAMTGFAAGLLALGLGAGAAEAGMNRLVPAEALGLDGAATPVAMCGYSCRSGGRYIPGPPSVCYAEGLRYCGSSRGGPPVIIERRRVFRDDDFGRRGRGDGERSRRGDRGWDRGGPGPGWR